MFRMEGQDGDIMDNKLIGFLILILLLIAVSKMGANQTSALEQHFSGPSAGTTMNVLSQDIMTCTPGTSSLDGIPYDVCVYTEYSYGSATARPKLQARTVRDVNNNILSEYMVGDMHINLKCEGDKFYVYKSLESFDDVNCDENGCDGLPLPSPSIMPEIKYIAGVVGDENPEVSAFVCWDYDEKGGSWAHTAICWGYLTTTWTPPSDHFVAKIVECKQDSDCEIGRCDKSGDWKSWHCAACPDTLDFNPMRSYSHDTVNRCIYQRCEDDNTVLYSYCVGSATNSLIMTQQQIETYLWECDADTECDTTETCESHFCDALVCPPGYKAENHQCVIGSECETDDDCFWCGITCQSKQYEDELICPATQPPANKICGCVSSKCTIKDIPPTCTPNEVRSKECVNATHIAYDTCMDGYSWEDIIWECPSPTEAIEHGVASGFCNTSINNCDWKVTCEEGYTYNPETVKCESPAPTYYLIIFVIIIVVLIAAFALTRGGKPPIYVPYGGPGW